MKIPLLLAAGVVSLASLVMADDLSAVLQGYYQSPITVTGSALTALATAVLSVESTWLESPQYTSVVQAVYNAAPKNIESSLATENWGYDSLTAQTWWTAVPDSAKAALSGQLAALDSVANSILGTPTATHNVSPRVTGALTAGVVGVVGMMGIMIAL